MQIAMIAAGKAEVADPALIGESEQESLPLQGLEIVAARALFTPEGEESNNIMKTIKVCINDAKKCKMRHAIKMIAQLVAVSKYMKLRARYKNHGGCKRPISMQALQLQVGWAKVHTLLVRSDTMHCI